MSTSANANADLDSCNADADLKMALEFLDGNISDDAERPKICNCTDHFDDDLCKTLNTANVEQDSNISINNDIQFVGKNSAVFHLLEDNEDYGEYEHNPNECNWNVFYKTLQPGEQNYSIKQEPINDDFTTNDATFSNNETKNDILTSDNSLNPSIQLHNIKLEPFSTVNKQNQEDTLSEETPSTTFVNGEFNELKHFSFLQNVNNIQEDTLLKETPCTTFVNDKHNELANFSFLKNFNNTQNPIFPRYSENQTLQNSDDESNIKTGKWKQNTKLNNLDSRNIPSECKYSETQKYRKKQWNEENVDTSSKIKNTMFKNTFQFNSAENDPPLSPPNDINSSGISSFSQPNNSNVLFNQPVFKGFKYADEPQEIQEDSKGLINFNTSNQQYSKICIDNEETVNSKSFERKKNTKNCRNSKLHHIIKDYLCPVSLVGSTIKFKSRKLANTLIRDELNLALKSYGTIENSWWTPDDMFFATFTLRSTAQHIFTIYPKNSTSSY